MVKKIFISIMIVMLLICCLSQEKYALTDIKPDDYEGWTYDEDTEIVDTTQNVMATAIKVVQIVTLGIAVIMLLMVAIKYMSASPEGKAEYKKSATAYIVGAVIMFGTAGILEIIESFADNFD